MAGWWGSRPSSPEDSMGSAHDNFVWLADDDMEVAKLR